MRTELVKLGFSRQSNRKADEGSKHPDRNAQFEYINAKVIAAQAQQQPVISVDTKKKELIGNFKNGGTDYRPKGAPLRVNVHDFEDKKLGKVVPYGVYDMTANAGFVSVGITSDTAEFAVQSIRCWLERMGRKRYPHARELTITADCGGSNGARVRLWKLELQKLADDTGLVIRVHHYPPGTSRRVGRRNCTCGLSQNWCVSLSTHPAPIRQTRRQYFDASVRTVCAVCWQWTQSFGQPVFSARYSAYTSALPTYQRSVDILPHRMHRGWRIAPIVIQPTL